MYRYLVSSASKKHEKRYFSVSEKHLTKLAFYCERNYFFSLNGLAFPLARVEIYALPK